MLIPQSGLLPNELNVVLTAVYCVALALAGGVDLVERRVPNSIVFPITALALLVCLWMPEPGRAFWLTAGGAAVGLLSFLTVRAVGKRLFGPGAMGMGDVKLAMLLGAMVGLQWVTAVLLLGILLAGTAATVLLVTRRARCSQHLAYGFYLSIAGLVILLLTSPG